MRFQSICARLRFISGLILLAVCASSVAAAETPLDEARVRSAGIRRLESRRLVLYTDMPSSPDLDELPQVFDQAFEIWCRYFGMNSEQHKNWRMRASIIQNPERFQAVGLMPADLPKFLNGLTRGYECWLYNQTSPYYRRHLLLHEGVHGFMFTLTGGYAPAWYMEGMAELLGTHQWKNENLELPCFPQSAAEVLKLGRIEIVQNDIAHGRGKQLIDVLAFDNAAYYQIEPYGWSWAALAFLDGHPRYGDRFRRLLSGLREPANINAKLRETYLNEGAELAEEWQVFTNEIDYNYDFARTAIDFKPGKPLSESLQTVKVDADRGWQNTGVALEAGKTYTLAASGSYQMANQPKPWMSEPNGISIRYVNGKPLGVLLAAVRPEKNAGASQFVKPIVVGTGTTITPQQLGTLYLKINDSAGELRDNAGQAKVSISAN